MNTRQKITSSANSSFTLPKKYTRSHSPLSGSLLEQTLSCNTIWQPFLLQPSLHGLKHPEKPQPGKSPARTAAAFKPQRSPIIRHVPAHLPTSASSRAAPAGGQAALVRGTLQYSAARPCARAWGQTEHSEAFRRFTSTREGWGAPAHPEKTLQKRPWLPRVEGSARLTGTLWQRRDQHSRVFWRHLKPPRPFTERRERHLHQHTPPENNTAPPTEPRF